MEQSVEHHVLGVKVFRFSKPNFMMSSVAMGEQWNTLGQALLGESLKNIQVTPDLAGMEVSDLVEPPLSSEDNVIFLGETYRVYISLINEGQEFVTDVVTKVEVLTPSNRHLLHQSLPEPKMPIGKRSDHIISHDVKDMGNHTLVCTVSYSLSNGEEKLLRKILNFSVAKPLEVRPEFQMVERDILMTVQIQNVMHNPVYIDNISFEPAAAFTALDYNVTVNGGFIFGKDNIFYPHTTRLYLYRILPFLNMNEAIGELSKNVSVGKMDIVWRSRYGERGRIQTGQLKAMITPFPALQVTLCQSPGAVMLEKEFSVTLKITNNSDASMKLTCHLEKLIGSGLLWSGLINQTFAELPSKESVNVKYNLLPVLPGIQRIGHLSFCDISSNQKKYVFSKLGEVFVCEDEKHADFTLLY